jgi:uncharacterized membrane protein
MELTLLHPKLVHLPIALAVLMPLLVGGFWVARGTDFLTRRIWWVAFVLQLLLVGSSFAAMQTGEIDEERAERVVPEAAIEAHEEAAEIFSWATVGLLPLLLPLGFVERKALQHGLAAAALAASAAILFLGYRVGDAGGAIVYEHGLTKLGTASGTSSPPAGRSNHYEDDDD